jgi:small subunit ribosomal protein S1
MSWTKKNVHPGKIISTSQEVEVEILDVDEEKRRISLGIKQTMENPWEHFSERHPVDSEVEGEVKNITEFGLFVDLGDDLDGMVHMSDISWDKSGEDAIQEFKKGDRVKARVLDIDTDKERISLGIKQLGSDPMAEAMSGLQRGVTVTCKVTKVQDNGIEVQVNDALQGFIRKADLSRERSEQRPDRFAVGDRVDAKVTSVDKATRKLGLTIKGLEIDEEKKAMQNYGSADSGATLGDILGAALSAKEATDDTPDAEPEAEPETEAAAEEADDEAKKDD